MSEDGRKQQVKLKELTHISEKLGCTLPQLAIGKHKTFHHYARLLFRTNFQALHESGEFSFT